MQQHVRNFIMVILLSTTSTLAFAQENITGFKGVPEMISDKGYWVVVSNVKTPKTSEIFFYNNAHALVYTEKVEGMKLNLKNRRTCMRLNKVLNNSLAVYELKQPKKEELVKNIFGLR